MRSCLSLFSGMYFFHLYHGLQLPHPPLMTGWLFFHEEKYFSLCFQLHFLYPTGKCLDQFFILAIVHSAAVTMGMQTTLPIANSIFFKCEVASRGASGVWNYYFSSCEEPWYFFHNGWTNFISFFLQMLWMKLFS